MPSGSGSGVPDRSGSGRAAAPSAGSCSWVTRPGYVDALTGEGIALGLAQARAAVDAIKVGRLKDYEAAYTRLGRRHDLLTKALLASSRIAPVRRAIVPAAARLPRLFGAAVDQLARPA